MRSRLTTIAALCRDKAREVFAWRGQRARGQVARSGDEPVWLAGTGGASPRYRINRSHPSVAAALGSERDGPALLDAMLTLIERTVPVERIWLDVSETEGAAVAPELEPAEVDGFAQQLAVIARTLPSSVPASERADRLLRHLPGNTAKLRTALLELLESEP